MKGSMQAVLSDPTVSSRHAHMQLSSPLHSPPRSHPPSSNPHHNHRQQRSISNNSLKAAFSTPHAVGGRTLASKRPPSSELPHSHPTKAPPNSRNQTPASSAASSPRHHTAPLPSGPPHTHPPPTPTTPMPLAPSSASKTAPSPTLAMTPRRATVLGPPPLMHSLAHGHAHLHAHQPSVFHRTSAVPSIHNESLSATSAGSLRHVGEGALSDDSDLSEAGSEGEGDPAVPAGAGTSAGVSNERNRSPNAGEHVPAPAESSPPHPHPPVVATRSLSLSRAIAGPMQPSPLSRVAVQQVWPDTVPETERIRAHTDSDDDASPSPGSTDSESAPCGSGDECIAKHHRAAWTRTGSMVKIRPRKVSRPLPRKTRSRSSTVASLAAPPLLPTPSVSSPVGGGAGTPVSPRLEPPLNHLRESLVRRGSQSSVQTVIANSLREAEHDGVDAGTPLISESWSEMSDQLKLAVTEEEIQLREAAWRALRDSLEIFADEVSMVLSVVLSLTMGMLYRVTPKCVRCSFCSLLANSRSTSYGRSNSLSPTSVRFGVYRVLALCANLFAEMLMRHRLHTPAAYIRKHVGVEDVRKTTGVCMFLLDVVLYSLLAL